MKNLNAELFKPFFKTIDKVIFGLEETDDLEEQPKTEEWINKEDQEDKIVFRSMN